jgi:hypothetical protein
MNSLWGYLVGNFEIYVGHTKHYKSCQIYVVGVLLRHFLGLDFVCCRLTCINDKTKLNSVASVRERIIPTERPPLFSEVVPTFADRGCHAISATDSHGH